MAPGAQPAPRDHRDRAPVGARVERADDVGGGQAGADDQHAIFRSDGVERAVSGYAGGTVAHPSYGQVSSGTTGAAESVEVTYDPRKIGLSDILRIYFSVATDPTQLNRQFPDSGPQYRGDIFVMDAGQKAVAERYIAQLDAAHIYRGRIVTRVDAFKGFYPAETYHQDYLLAHPDSPYIATYDLPKVAALKALLPADYRASPTRVL